MTDRIVTHPANDAYRNGYDTIFGNTHQDGQQDAHSEPRLNDQAIKEPSHLESYGYRLQHDAAPSDLYNL